MSKFIWFCLLAIFHMGHAQALPWTDRDKAECIKAVYKNSPNAPEWYPNYYCDCAGREVKTGSSLEQAVFFCQGQMKNLMKGLAKSCVEKIGNREENKPKIKACVDKGPGHASGPSGDGGYTVVDKGMAGKTAYLELKSNNYKGDQFSDEDIASLSKRLAKRLCTDQDTVAAMKIGMKWHYDFLGSDGVKVRSFILSQKDCSGAGNR